MSSNLESMRAALEILARAQWSGDVHHIMFEVNRVANEGLRGEVETSGEYEQVAEVHSGQLRWTLRVDDPRYETGNYPLYRRTENAAARAPLPGNCGLYTGDEIEFTDGDRGVILGRDEADPRRCIVRWLDNNLVSNPKIEKLRAVKTTEPRDVGVPMDKRTDQPDDENARRMP